MVEAKLIDQSKLKTVLEGCNPKNKTFGDPVKVMMLINGPVRQWIHARWRHL
jgi:hypothetical protein